MTTTTHTRAAHEIAALPATRPSRVVVEPVRPVVGGELGAGMQGTTAVSSPSEGDAAPRRRDPTERPVLVVVNATPHVHTQYRLGVPCPAPWWELVNRDEVRFGGSGVTNPGARETHPVDSHAQYQSILITMPPLAVTVLAPERW